MKTLFRKHNALGFNDAFLTSFKGYNDQIIYTWTKVASKAHLFNTDVEAIEVLETLKDSNYTYIIN